MAERNNPYIAGAPVVEKRMFFGRERVFEWIENSLTGKYVDHILVLHGQRRVGKTSVLKHIPNRLPDRYIPVFIDLQGRVSTTLDRFLHWLAREITRALKDQGIEIDRPDRAAFEADPEHFESVFLPSIESKMGEYTLLLTFDEFDTFESTDAQEGLAIPFMAILMRLMNHPKLSFIFSIGSSGRKLENMQAAYTNFFKQALYRKISFLEQFDARDLIVKPVEGVLKYSDDAIRRIHKITSGHPYFVQLVCHELFSECQKNNQWQVDVDDVENILEAVVERGTVNLKFVWDEASDLEKWILAILASDNENKELSNLEAQLKKQQVRFTRQELERSLLHLKEKDVLTDDNNFVIHLMEIWLKRNRPMEQVREELEDINPIVNRFLEIGQEYHDASEFEIAIENYENALKMEPDNLEAHLLLGNSHLAFGDYGKAIVEFETVFDIKLDDVVAQKGLCDTYLLMGDEYRSDEKLDEAEYAYSQVLNINPQHKLANLRMAQIHHSKAVVAIIGGKEVALTELEKALDYAQEEVFKKVHAELKSFIAGELQFSELLFVWFEQAKEMGLWHDAESLLSKYQSEAEDGKDFKTTITEIRNHIKEHRQKELKNRAARLKRLGNYPEAIEIWKAYIKVAPKQRGETNKKISTLRNLDKSSKTKKPERKKSLLSRFINFLIAIIGIVMVGVVGFLLIQPESPLQTVLVPPTTTPTLTPDPTPEPTTIPLSWTRLSSASFLDRDSITDIIFDPNEREVIYLGTLNSGIYKTINSGDTWQSYQNGLGGSSIGSLAIHPANSNILYACILDAGLYKTSNGGLLWQKLEINVDDDVDLDENCMIVLNQNTPDTLYLLDNWSIYKSSDSGQNWESIHLQPEYQIQDIAINPEGVLHFSTNFENSPIRRINPDTYEVEEFTPTRDFSGDEQFVYTLSIDPESGRIFSTLKDSPLRALLISDDEGNTWQQQDFDCVNVFPNGNGNVLCVGHEQTSYSDDNGDSWSELHLPEYVSAPSTGAISPYDSNTIILEGNAGIFKSVDGGDNWEEIGNGIGNAQVQLLVNSEINKIFLDVKTQTEELIYSSDIDVWDFELVFKDWDRWGSDTYISILGDIYRYDINYEDSSIMKSINGEEFESTGIVHDQGIFTGGYIQDGREILYISPNRDNDSKSIYISEDMGETWAEVEYQRSTIHGGALTHIIPDPTDPDASYSIGSDVYHSKAGFEFWNSCYLGLENFDFGHRPPEGYSVISIHPEISFQYFVATRSEGLYINNNITTCDNLQQVPIESGLDNKFIRSVVRHPENPDTIYVGTANGFYMSYDGGDSWGKVNDGLLGALTIYSLAVDPNNPGVVYASTPYGIFQLIDH